MPPPLPLHPFQPKGPWRRVAENWVGRPVIQLEWKGGGRGEGGMVEGGFGEETETNLKSATDNRRIGTKDICRKDGSSRRKISSLKWS